MLRFVAAAVGLLLAVGFGSAALAAPDPAGDWHGVIAPIPALKLRVAVHIEKAAAGGYAGTMKSLDQGGGAIPLTAVSADGDVLSFTVGPIGGAFTGRWDTGQSAFVGQWTQGGRSLPLTLASGPPPAEPKAVIEGLDGRWEGLFSNPNGQLRLVLRISTDASGTSAALDSPDQGASGLPVDSLKRDGEKVAFALPGIGADYAGALSADGRTLTGAWTQLGRTTPLNFTRVSANAAPAGMVRPQTPKKPYPYREEEVTFEDAAAHVKLAGTLTLPEGKGPFPAVVLVAGSGPNTRNEPILGHQIFLVLADHLTRHGIAVLRYDKRGTGASGGDYAKATTVDFADDALAAETYLRDRPQVDPAKVGLIGHSEGGLIVPMVAVRDPKVAFIVMMAGPGVDGVDVLAEQGRLIAKAMGASDAAVEEQARLRKALFEAVGAEKDPALAAVKVRAALADYAKAQGLPETALTALASGQLSTLNSGWFRFFLTYDPAATLRKVRCPVLALNGSKDLQVPPDQNLPAVRAALAHNPHAEVEELPNLNHLFQTAKTGGPQEYGQIEETIAPVALATITDWILKETRRRGPP
jgi:pimeloyl-ACP methyl ester carboxylesterase